MKAEGFKTILVYCVGPPDGDTRKRCWHSSEVKLDDLPTVLERCPVRVIGLMTMPPLARRPEDNRQYFAALRELAGHHDLPQLSMGTSQDFVAAVQEGATIVRLGTTLYAGAP